MNKLAVLLDTGVAVGIVNASSVTLAGRVTACLNWNIPVRLMRAVHTTNKNIHFWGLLRLDIRLTRPSSATSASSLPYFPSFSVAHHEIRTTNSTGNEFLLRTNPLDRSI